MSEYCHHFCQLACNFVRSSKFTEHVTWFGQHGVNGHLGLAELDALPIIAI